MTESGFPSEFDSLSPQELKDILRKYPIMLRTDPLGALKLFQNKSKSIASTPTTESPFTKLARKGELPVKVTGGK